MHMADALLSPAVGGTMWGASVITIAYCSAKVRNRLDDRNVPLMGVLGAFLFAAQMINFTIPGTGSSGHLGGGLLLSILLGPHGAFLSIASVLVVQALFFADGGLLALGCNIFNIGFFPAFIAYPLIYKKILGPNPGRYPMTMATMIAAIACLQLGSLAVVLETFFSGISVLPFPTFVLLMQPIHLAIGIVEGFVTLAVVSFIYKVRPEILENAFSGQPAGNHPLRDILLAFMAVAIIAAGVLSWFASKNPDGLEWAIFKVTGKEELAGPNLGLHGALARIQDKTALLRDYSFGKSAEQKIKPSATGETEKIDRKAGTSIAGLVGTLITLAFSVVIVFFLKRRKTSPPG
ncbi:nickel ABC transporter, membrane protein NikMN [Geotalea daltonii FRC-32]|uniref:Nickel ABC transporter, membrane protein NikMN n=1 Tax=Geotalea daltonii (strain DSM 22248 / JCM 15807 / FRC-32) TaxID=316067 RepID=B9M2C9_GEODF|nr:energy-coupling factor ABC transporter permease [Geotalea daltonii]ACM19308.1 nickel ABC transporter, membrane protein NikMN [Geotalea daltonii FRC-32]